MAMIDNRIYVAGRPTAAPGQPRRDLRAAARARRHGVDRALPADVGRVHSVAAEFALHPLAVEDALKGHQRAKLERYGDTLFVVLRPARYLDDPRSVEFGELHLFVGPDFVVTIRHAESPDLAGAAPAGGRPRAARPGPGGGALRRSSTRSSTSTRPSSPASRTTSTRSRTSSSAATRGRRGASTSCSARSSTSSAPPVRSRMLEALLAGSRNTTSTRAAALAPRRPGPRLPDHRARRRFRALLQNALTVHATLVDAQQNDEMREPHRGQPRAERGGQEDLRLGGHPLRPDPDRHHLRHELRLHARAALELGYPMALAAW